MRDFAKLVEYLTKLIQYFVNLAKAVLVEYLTKLIQYFGNLAKVVMRSHNKKFLSKFSKILAEDNKVFNFKGSSFTFFQNLIKTLYVQVVVYIS